MKKLFTLLTLVLVTISCFATDYTDELVLSGQKPQQKTISVNEKSKGRKKRALRLTKWTTVILQVDLEQR